MSEMVERVAAAAHDANEKFGGYEVTRPFAEMPPINREQFLVIARAAIEAMREPTGDMLKAEMDIGGYGFNDECFPADPKNIWHAMIESALK